MKNKKIICLSLLATTSVNANLYDNSTENHCIQYYNNQSNQDCKENTRFIEHSYFGLNLLKQEKAVQTSIDKALDNGFETGRFVPPLELGARMYRYIETTVSPLVGNSYIENRHHTFFLNPKMMEMQHIMSTFRHGQYGGENGKLSDHEVVLIQRLTATLEPVDESIYRFLGAPYYLYEPIEFPGYKLYRYRTQNKDSYVTPNYTTTPGDMGSNGDWSMGSGHKSPENEKQINPFLFGNGSFESEMQFGYEVYLLVRFNDDGTVDVGMPYRNSGGLIEFDGKHISRFEPAYYDMTQPEVEKSDGGWKNYSLSTDLTAYDDNFRRFATISIDKEPKLICRYHNNENVYFGYVENTLTNGYEEKVCTTGKRILIKDSVGGIQVGSSKPYQFQYLDLESQAMRDQTVKGWRGKALCVVDDNEHYGVGTTDKLGVCMQEGNVLWDGQNIWKFNKNDYVKLKYDF